MREKLLEIVNTVLENNNKNTINNIQDDMNLREDLNLDSLDLAELTVRIEKEFNTDIFEDSIVTTIGEILKKIEKKNGE
ncbi:phosphopantetheine-binding protein [Caldithrix abyssi DSM 13497]|uniref:Acyl carrier protein n=1 Tax=Caldithrix abyssi DSM 13497 TaxID=880073 RepID=H1XS59_CALAY|nr:acyl carrier protein [Caldithrix abyssi]APF20162.1 acyl carrier protein [Caldithrix abyssi DSM 13497]EHO40223.1 phosphopantetheine-binding protein [Caldithrix abyssi DSM 13497]